jgi:acyl carrier protein
VSDLQPRLIRCFQAVFPELSESKAARASASGLTAWDSVATATLAAAVEEEFGIEFEAEEIERINSFQSCLDLLTARQSLQ